MNSENDGNGLNNNRLGIIFFLVYMYYTLDNNHVLARA